MNHCMTIWGAGHLIIYRFNLLIDFVLAKLQIPMEFPFRKTSIGTQTKRLGCLLVGGGERSSKVSTTQPKSACRLLIRNGKSCMRTNKLWK
jgi:hypothetical protein